MVYFHFQFCVGSYQEIEKMVDIDFWNGIHRHCLFETTKKVELSKNKRNLGKSSMRVVFALKLNVFCSSRIEVLFYIL